MIYSEILIIKRYNIIAYNIMDLNLAYLCSDIILLIQFDERQFLSTLMR